MNRIILLVFATFFSIELAFSEEKNNKSFEIMNCSDPVLKQKYITAVEKSDFSCYRFKNKARIMRFEDGAELHLFSVDASVMNGASITTDCFLKDGVVPQNDILNLSVDGSLMIKKESKNYKK